MTCNSIYLTALSLIGETEHNTGTADYAERAIRLTEVVLARFARVSELLSGTKISSIDIAIDSLDADFPLDERLCSAVSLALASLLVLDELPELAAELDARADAAASDAAKDAIVISPTREVYTD